MYQALYRQYRPKTFDEVLGQKHITVTLKNQIQKDNIGHAYLFSGTRGTGKTSTAKILSRAVNCIDLKEGNPCNQCEICTGILDESIMDVIEMDAASNRRIDDIRDLRDKVIYPPSRAKYKVYIIDEVHMLTQEAFNALLKTLEEPPKHLIFILATTEPEKLPQTILSRCQRFDFKRVSTRDIVENMKSIGEKLDIQIDDKALNLIARNADGAMRDALSLLDQCISFSENKITYEDAVDILGITNNDQIINLTDSIIRRDLKVSLSQIDDIIQNGKDINQFIKDIILHFRNLMIAKTTKDPSELIQIDEETMEKYLEQTQKIELEFILKALDILTMSDEKSKWSTQPRIILEMAVIQIVKLEEELTLEDRIKRLEMGIKVESSSREIRSSEVETFQESQRAKTREIEDKNLQTSKNTKKENPIENGIDTEQQKINEDKQVEENNEPIVDNKSIDISQIKSSWSDILQKIKKEKMNIYALLIEGKPSTYQNGLLTIGYKEPYGFHKEAVNSSQNKEFVEKTLSSYFNTNININLIMEREKEQPKEDEKKNKDKAIKEVVDFFGENIVEIK